MVPTSRGSLSPSSQRHFQEAILPWRKMAMWQVWMQDTRGSLAKDSPVLSTAQKQQKCSHALSMQQRHTGCEGPCRSLKPRWLLSSKLCGLMTKDQVPLNFHPKPLDTTRPQKCESVQKEEESVEIPGKVMSGFFVSPEEGGCSFRNQGFRFGNQIQKLNYYGKLSHIAYSPEFLDWKSYLKSEYDDC